MIRNDMLLCQFIRNDLQKVPDLIGPDEFKRCKLEAFEEKHKFDELRAGTIAGADLEHLNDFD